MESKRWIKRNVLNKKGKIPKHKKVTHGRLACHTRLSKKYLFKWCRTMLTIGGKLIESEGCTLEATTETTTIKILWKSVMSIPGEKHITIETKDMCLVDNEEMDKFECFQMRMSYFPQKLTEAYDLLD